MHKTKEKIEFGFHQPCITKRCGIRRTQMQYETRESSQTFTSTQNQPNSTQTHALLVARSPQK